MRRTLCLALAVCLPFPFACSLPAPSAGDGPAPAPTADGSLDDDAAGDMDGVDGAPPDSGAPTPRCVDEPPDPIDCGPDCVVVANNGAPAKRVSMVVVGDGFTADEIPVYSALVDDLSQYMFTNALDAEPYVRYRRYINLYRLDLVSNESGVDDPAADVWVDTALDGERGCTDWMAGLCQVNWEKAHDAIDDGIAGSDVEKDDWRLVLLNSPDDCGGTHYPARGTLAVYCPHQPQSPDIALHEGGHAFHHLGDTYWTRDETYEGDEPDWPNLTTDPTGAKWAHWLGYEDPTLGPVGAFEGGMQYRRGVFRPSLNQKMGSAEYCHQPGPPHCPHDAVSREKIITDLYRLVRPLDGWTENEGVLSNPETLTVDVVDCETIQVEWRVDGEVAEGDFGEVFPVGTLGLSPGRHVVEARAYDDTPWVRGEAPEMEQRISWTIELD